MWLLFLDIVSNEEYNYFVLKVINLNDIDFDDKKFVITYAEHLESLVNSIKKVGLVNPPLVKKVNGRYKIISGYKRLKACKQIGIYKIKVQLIEKGALECFLLNLYENLGTRKLNEIEKSIVLCKLIEFGVSKAKVIAQFLPLFDLSPHIKILNNYLKLATLGDEIKLQIAERKITVSNALRLLRFKKEERNMVFNLIQDLNFNINKQKEFMTLLHEISSRERVSVSSILIEPVILNILGNEKLNLSQKGDRIFFYLRRRRFPSLALFEDKFKDLKKELKLAPEMVLRHSPYFEGEDYKLEIKFKNVKELKELIYKFRK
ncbi:ParB/RepB/Spo0J family partition protein [candidate division WOR-3 bacterium]|nr:ParB/RepB/Spo0J family partition protein [candidate division WOR-3 bacterium]